MIVKKTFDDCENEGLQHSWDLFKVDKPQYIEGSAMSSGLISCGGPKEILNPVKQEPEPYETREKTHMRRCRNCEVIEEFIEDDRGDWQRREGGDV